MVSDQAKALTKLAIEGLGCQRIPDLFHASHELVKLLGTRVATKLRHVRTRLSKAMATAALLKETGRSPEKLRLQEQIIVAAQIEEQHLLDGQTQYYEILHSLSTLVHPFSLDPPRPQTSSEVMVSLDDLLATVPALLDEYGISDSHLRLKKLRSHSEEIAASIDLWWTWVRESLRPFSVEPEVECWLVNGLLPVLYWKSQLQRTSTASLRQTYDQAYKQAQLRLQCHRMTGAMTEEEWSRWQSWGEWIVTKFQRTSSAVEGRNGVLSRMNHAQRSIPLQRLKVLTVIHNFGITRKDGTTNVKIHHQSSSNYIRY